MGQPRQATQVGSRVRARYRAPNGKEYYDGKIDIVNHGGTYAIHYDDGDREGYPKGHKYYSKSLPGVLPSNIMFKGKILSDVDQKEGKKKAAESEGTTDDDCARRDGIMEVAAPLFLESSNGPGRIRAGTWHTVVSSSFKINPQHKTLVLRRPYLSMVLTLAHLLCPLHPLHRQVSNPRLATPTFQRRRSKSVVC